MFMQNYFVGIDLGTGSTKAVAVDINGKTIATAQSYYTTNNPKPGYSEQNPELIWQAFVNCISKIHTTNRKIFGNRVCKLRYSKVLLISALCDRTFYGFNFFKVSFFTIKTLC